MSPLVIVLVFWGLALWLVWCGRFRSGLVVGLLCIFGLWTMALPMVAHTLTYQLEKQYPAKVVDQLPQADAIVLLGGALSGSNPPERPNFDLGSAADRVWYAATLYLAGKVPLVLVSGGNQPGVTGMQVEADAIRSMLLTLGVPTSAIRLEGLSRNTIENAQHTLELIEAVSAQRLLLVTSAMHMPRALKIFRIALRGSNIQVVPASTDVEGLPHTLHPVGRWLPDANAFALSSRAIKEYQGLIALFLMNELWR